MGAHRGGAPPAPPGPRSLPGGPLLEGQEDSSRTQSLELLQLEDWPGPGHGAKDKTMSQSWNSHDIVMANVFNVLSVIK